MPRQFVFIISIFLVCCSQPNPVVTNIPAQESSAVNTDSVLVHLSKEILPLLKSKNYKALSEYGNPAWGIAFSPYAFIDTLTLQTLSLSAIDDSAGIKRLWGTYQGSGEPILLNIDEYFGKFVYDVDFISVGKVSVNESLSKGNMQNNLKEIYKECDFVEYYFPGSDPALEGMDWKALRLVFKKQGEKIYLIAIVHDQWTI